jgi:hypothetical protein
MASTLVLEGSTNEGCIPSAAAAHICVGRTHDGALDRLRIDAFASGKRVDDAVRARVEREF